MPIFALSNRPESAFLFPNRFQTTGFFKANSGVVNSENPLSPDFAKTLRLDTPFPLSVNCQKCFGASIEFTTIKTSIV